MIELKKDLTELVFILDGSSSMFGLESNDLKEASTRTTRAERNDEEHNCCR